MTKFKLFLLIVLLNNYCNAQIIDYVGKNGTGFSLNQSINIPKIENKITIFIFEKRQRSFDPENITLSERLSTCDIDYEKFAIFRFNLVSGICPKFDSSTYVLNGMQWYKPKSIEISKHLVCISIPDTTTLNLISNEFGDELLKNLDAYPRKIGYKKPLAFLTFNDKNKVDLESHLLSLISKRKSNEIEDINKKLIDSLVALRKIINKNEPRIQIGTFFMADATNVNYENVIFNNQRIYGISLGRSYNKFNTKFETSINIGNKNLDIGTEKEGNFEIHGYLQDHQNDFYQSILKHPKINESIRFNCNSVGLSLRVYRGTKQSTFFGAQLTNNFNGRTQQSVNQISVDEFGVYPVLNFDTLFLGQTEIKNNNFSFNNNFFSYAVEFGRKINLLNDRLCISLSAIYSASENMLREHSSNIFELNNDDIKINSTFNSIPSFKNESINVQIQLYYIF
jgi:hypothetical protein